MRFSLGKMICAVALCIAGTQILVAQPYHQLSIDDFEGNPRSRTGVIAYTNCTIDLKYQAHPDKGFYRLIFDIRLILNRDKSWMDKSRIRSSEMLAEILKHEQGHYIIAYLEQQEVLREMGKTRFVEDYQYRVSEIFNRIDAKYKQLNYDYDEDTAHMVNRTQQNSWDLYFRKRLEFMPPT